MPDEPENLTLLLLREIRAELREQRSLLLATTEYVRKMEQRLDARITGVRDELELIIKSELMGRLAHFETRIEQMVEQRLAEQDEAGLGLPRGEG